MPKRPEILEAIRQVDLMEKVYSLTLFYLIAREMQSRIFTKFRMTLRDFLKGV